MKAYKRTIINHIKAGKPFMYQKYQSSQPNSIMVVEPYDEPRIVHEDKSETYHLKSYYKRQDGQLFSNLDSTSITIKANGTIQVFLSCGDINTYASILLDKIILLDKNYKPITK